VAGALPPVIGWMAVEGSLQLRTGVLFGVLFAWQMPHVMAVAWMHRQEYAAAGLELLPRKDPSGRVAALRALVFAGLLAAITLVPGLDGVPGAFYYCGVAFLNGVLLIAALRFLSSRTRDSAKGLFLVSIVYLPLLLALMITL
jgi:heme o synthase